VVAIENDNVTRAVPVGPPVAGPPGVGVALGTGTTLGGVEFPPEQLASSAATARTIGGAAAGLMLRC
jgi:hypothetical protein